MFTKIGIPAFFLLSIFDLYMTLNHTVGAATCEESNPIAASIIENTGTLGTVTYKLLLVALVILCVNKVVSVKPKLAYGVLGFGIGLMTAVAVWHLYIVLFFAAETVDHQDLAQPTELFFELTKNIK